METETLRLLGKARERFGYTLHVGDALPHIRTRERGDFSCPKFVNAWRKPLHLRPYYHNDWLVGCPICHTAQWRFAKYRGGWTLRDGGVPHLLPLCPVDTREDLLMLTDCRFPDKICPWTIDEENGILVDKHNKAELILTNNFWNASEGYRVILKENKHFWMGSGTQERDIMAQIAQQCPEGAKVLVGGLGLGIIVLELCKRKPKSIKIYEINQDVANLVYPKVSKWCEEHYKGTELELVIGDVRRAKGSFDFVFYDIWDSADSKHIPLVKEMRELGENLVTENGKAICWMEERILGEERKDKTPLDSAIEEVFANPQKLRIGAG